MNAAAEPSWSSSGSVEATSAAASAPVGAVGQPLANGVPARAQPRLHRLRLVVEEQQLIDGRIGGDGAHDRREPLALAPDHRRVVERVAGRGRRRQQRGEPLRGRRAERGERQRRAARPRRRRARCRRPSRSGSRGPAAVPRPAARARRVRPGRRAPWRARAGRGRRRPRRRPPPRRARGRRAGRRRARRCGRRPPSLPPRWRRPSAPPRRRRAPRRGQRSARGARRPRRTRGTARPSPRPSSSTSAASSVAASSTAWLPTEATVWKRSPRRTASAFTATLPLCEISATRPAGRGTSTSPQSAAAPWNETSPSQLGPITGMPDSAAAAASSDWSAAAPASANPAANTTAAPQPRRPAARTTSGTPAAGIATTTASTGSGRSSSVGHARPSVHLAPRRVHAPHRPGEAERGEVAHRGVAVGAGPVGRADDGDGARAKQRGEVGRASRGPRRAQRSTFATPRRSSERAMISRWISLVPSQIRSTRSSRRKRSATLSRR